ncbi:VOC family protein [Verrucomicrobiota bacterium sgz303538]
MTDFYLPDGTRITQVQLRIRDLAGTVEFYEQVIGLSVLSREERNVSLAAPGQSHPLLVLSEDPQAVARPRRTTGLYHLAIRFPTRADLAHAVQRLIQHEYPIEGASNHLVSEAIYLSDPAGNGVELYADVPRNRWVWRDGQVTMSTEPLDFGSLLGAAGNTSSAKAPPGTDIGHIHLHVAELSDAERFFHEFLGMAVTQRSYPGALFFSAGGYHHHIGANTWAGKIAPPDRSEGLLSYRLAIPGVASLETLRERATAFGYEVGEGSAARLAIRDLNGAWLEITAG